MKIRVDIIKIIAIIMVTMFISYGYTTAEEKSGNTTTTIQKLAVIDFDAIGSGIDKELGKAIAELMRSCFIATGKYSVVDRNSMAKTILEKKVIVTEQTGIEMGKLLNTDLVVDGSILKIGASYILTAKIANVTSGEVLLGRNLIGKVDDQLPDMAKQMVTLLTETKEPVLEKPSVSITTTVSTTTTSSELNK